MCSNLYVPSNNIGDYMIISKNRLAYIGQVKNSIAKLPLPSKQITRIIQELEEYYKEELEAIYPNMSIYVSDRSKYEQLVNSIYGQLASIFASDTLGNIQYYNGEALYVIGCYVRKYGTKEQQTYLPVMLTAGFNHALAKELNDIKRNTTTTVLDMSKFSCDPLRFGYSRTPYVLRRYMEHIVVDENEAIEQEYKYTIDVRKYLYSGVVAHLTDRDPDAIAKAIEGRQQGLFLPFLSMEEEIRVVKYICDSSMYKTPTVFTGAISGLNPNFLEMLTDDNESIRALAKGRELTIEQIGGIVLELYELHNRTNENINVYSLTDTHISYQLDKPISKLSPTLYHQSKRMVGFPVSLEEGYF